MAVYLSESDNITADDLRRFQPAEACTEIGADDDRRNPALGLALILAPWIVGVVGFALHAWLAG